MTILYIAFGLLAIGLIIFIHEAGHFLAAKKVGVRVDRFALGFDPMVKGRYLRFFCKKWGETEYVIGMIPFGGYVKLAGEIPEEGSAPEKPLADDELLAKSVGARALVFVAGALMNFLSAFIFFMIAFSVGVGFPEPRVGNVVVGGPGWLGGLHPGDEVLEIDGEKVDDYTEILLASALSGRETTLRFKVRRPDPEGGDPEELEIDVVTKWNPARGMSMIWVDPSNSLELAADPPSDSPAGKAGLAKGDRIVGASLGGVPVPDLGEQFLVQRLIGVAGLLRRDPTKPTVLEVLSPSGERRTIELRLAESNEKPESPQLGVAPGLPGYSGTTLAKVIEKSPLDELLDPHEKLLTINGQALEAMDWYVIASRHTEPTLRLGVETPSGSKRVVETPRERFLESLIRNEGYWTSRNLRVGRIESGSPLAKAGVQADDVFLSIGGTRVYNLPDIDEVLKSSDAKSLTLTVIRGEDSADLTVPRGALEEIEDLEWRSFAPISIVLAGSPAERAGITAGSRIVKVADKPILSFADLQKTMSKLELGGETEVAWIDPNGATRTARIPLEGKSYEPLGLAFVRPEVTIQDGVLGSFQLGIDRSIIVVKQVFVTLRSLIRRDVELKNLSGPVGITHLFTKVAEMGWVKLLFWMAVVSVNLGVLNLLPFPILDGGHLLFLLIEKIKGSPVSFGVQEWATRVAFLLIISLALFVTYHDISRLLFS